MKMVNSALGALRKINYKGKTFTRRSELSDFYKPSKEMSEYQHMFMGGVGLASGVVLSRVL